MDPKTPIIALACIIGIFLNFRSLDKWASTEPDAGPGMFPVFLLCFAPFAVVALFSLIWVLEKIVDFFEGTK